MECSIDKLTFPYYSKGSFSPLVKAWKKAMASGLNNTKVKKSDILLFCQDMSKQFLILIMRILSSAF